MAVEYVIAGNFCVDTVISPDGVRRDNQLGGTAVYGAVGARIWSPAVGISTIVGCDFARRVREELRGAGIDTSGVREVARSHGLIWFTGYLSGDDRIDDVQQFALADSSQRNPRYVLSGSTRHRRLWPVFSPAPKDMPEEYAAASRVHLAPMPPRRLAQNAAWFKERGTGVSIDWPFWRGADTKVLDRTILRNVDAVLPSMAEMQQFRSGPIEDAATEIATAGPRFVIVKRGSAGVAVFDFAENRVTMVPAYDTVVRDPTGAGDAFCGGFAVGLAEMGDPVAAAVYGVVSASFVIEDFGALHALTASREEAETRRAAVTRSIQRVQVAATA